MFVLRVTACVPRVIPGSLGANLGTSIGAAVDPLHLQLLLQVTTYFYLVPGTGLCAAVRNCLYSPVVLVLVHHSVLVLVQ